MPQLFDSLTIGYLNIPNRMVMSPMTRGRATADAIPTDSMAKYYSLRSDAGLIITEATGISPQGYGWLNAPGIWSQKQVDGWKKVTDAVHKKNGRIFLQLWHMGRVVHPDFLNGKLPLAPSAIAAKGEAHTPQGTKAYVTPKPMTLSDIQHTINDYAAAAKRAKEAGFDGVEIHAANGYLIDEFIRSGANQRTDQYGGSAQNRVRFLNEVVNAVTLAIGAQNTGVRVSPVNVYNDMHDDNPTETYAEVSRVLNLYPLAYLHVLEALPGSPLYTPGKRISPSIRKEYQGVIITNGGYDKMTGDDAIRKGEADAIAFGVPFLANPDLVYRYQNNAALNTPHFDTFYTPGDKGYLDYPLAT